MGYFFLQKLYLGHLFPIPSKGCLQLNALGTPLFFPHRIRVTAPTDIVDIFQHLGNSRPSDSESANNNNFILFIFLTALSPRIKIIQPIRPFFFFFFFVSTGLRECEVEGSVRVGIGDHFSLSSCHQQRQQAVGHN